MKIVQLYETSKDTEMRLTKIPCAKARAKLGRNLSCVITLNPKNTFQTLKGFGCAITESAGYVLSFLSKEEQNKIVRNCFSEQGNNYSIVRTHMNSCDFSLENWACLQEKDESLASFSFERTEKYILPILHLAYSQNKNLSVMVTPWSPPAWMKTNNDMNNGGKLKKKYRKLWADYFVKFLQGLKERKLNPKYISIQNECEAVQTWDSCIWTAKEEADFAVNYLKPAFIKNNLSDVKILIWDHNRDNLVKRMKKSFSVPGAKDVIDGMAFHWYSGDQYENVAKCSKALEGKELFFTEGSIEGGSKPNKWYCGERYGHNIINDLNSGCTAWIDWNMALNIEGGPNHVGNFCDAAILVDTDKKEVIYQNSFYYLGHFSRFITPLSKRIGCTMNGFAIPAAFDGRMGSLMESTAFKRPDGKVVLVVMNRTEDDMVFELDYGGVNAVDKNALKAYSAKVEEDKKERSFVCPPRSIQTYIFE